MPRQNRVTPFGDIVATPARGRFMGNRGCLHDASGRLVRQTRLNAWIYCLLEFKGRRRALMQPGRYTELFFLDEATALAAGHRPCAECQRGRYKEFMRCWALGNPSLVGEGKLRAPVVDAVLQRERMGPGGEKVIYRARIGDLPERCFVTTYDRETHGHLIEEGGLRAWHPGKYGALTNAPKNLKVSVLTPASTVKAIAAGFVPK